MNQIKNHYHKIFNQCSPYDIKLGNGLITLRCNIYENLNLAPIYIITEDFGIRILAKYMEKN